MKMQQLDLRIDWGEQDLLGHVNNVSIIRYLQAGRVLFMENIGRFHNRIFLYIFLLYLRQIDEIGDAINNLMFFSIEEKRIFCTIFFQNVLFTWRMTILKFVFQNQKQSTVSYGNVQCVIFEHFMLFVQKLILDIQVMHQRNKSKISNI